MSKKKNRTTYNRSPNDGATNLYGKIDVNLIEDNRLDFAQMGIMVYILKQSDDFVVNKSYIRKISNLGMVTFDKAWKGLIELGYIEKIGDRRYVKWIVNEYVE